MNLQEAFDAGFEAVKAYVEESISLLDVRLAEMEAKLLELANKPEPVSAKSAVIDREGQLVLTLSDGSTKELGVVVGKDGSPGSDGLGFDDLSVDYDGERSLKLRFTKGDSAKEFGVDLPIVLDRGIYKEGQAYSAGDGVTWAGSFWIAQEPTTDKPEASKSWRLAVKRGRNGKDAPNG